jgi:glutathione synthase/RimK-type ligase-like ATP-grasp enzyme
MKIALICYKKQERYSSGAPDEDRPLFNFLLNKGLNTELVIWNDPLVDWSKFQVAVLKSPWDYHEQFTTFNALLQKMDDMKIRVLNLSEIVRWNSDKRYLKDITASGLNVIPSVFFEKGAKASLSNQFDLFNTAKLVMKPCVSASAKNTLVVTQENLGERQQQLNEFLLSESFMLQPFVNEITDGELSFIFFGGIYSHAVLKLPKKGDFRVQHFHGGTIKNYYPEPKLLIYAQRYVDAFAKNCLYARVDGVMIKEEFYLMELELIEPYLFLETGKSAYELYYQALSGLIGK